MLLVHPGGPFWKNRDAGAWSIPKGEYTDEPPLQAALREFREETGFELSGPSLELTPVRQGGGKWVQAFAMEGDLDPAAIRSTTFETEWPPRSGRFQVFPEVDRAEWFGLEEARKRILPAQRPILDELEAILIPAPGTHPEP